MDKTLFGMKQNVYCSIYVHLVVAVTSLFLEKNRRLGKGNTPVSSNVKMIILTIFAPQVSHTPQETQIIMTWHILVVFEKEIEPCAVTVSWASLERDCDMYNIPLEDTRREECTHMLQK